MRMRAFLLLALPLAIAPRARADQVSVTLPDVRARTDEMQQKVQLAHERLAEMSKALMTPALAQTTIDASDQTGRAFKLISARVAVDGVLQYDQHDLAGTQKVFRGDRQTYELEDVSVPFERRPQLRFSDGARGK